LILVNHDRNTRMNSENVVRFSSRSISRRPSRGFELFEDLQRRDEKEGSDRSSRTDATKKRSGRERADKTNLADVNLKHSSRYVIGSLPEVVPDEWISVLFGEEVEDDGEMAVRRRAH